MMRFGTAAAPALLTLALVAACGNSEEEPARGNLPVARPPEPADTLPLAPPDTEPAYVPVELPSAFPADFPIAPESTVIEADSRPESDGVLSHATIVTSGAPGDIFGWYRTALESAGWMMASENEPGSLTLRATQGESYVELATEAETGPDETAWARTRATIWKTER